MMLHLEPFQCIVSVWLLLVSVYPTAQISFALIAATPVSVFLELPLAFGLGITVHFEPSQCSIRVPWNELVFTEVSVQPTANRLFDETAVTLTSWEEVRPFGLVEPFGAGTMLHAEPSQCSVTAL